MHFQLNCEEYIYCVKIAIYTYVGSNIGYIFAHLNINVGVFKRSYKIRLNLFFWGGVFYITVSKSC